MSVPVLRQRERLVDTVVEVLVVREDDMAADVVELRESGKGTGGWDCRGQRTNPSGVTSVEARPPGTSFASTSSHEASF